MNKIITKALMRHHNEFFTMTEEEQDIFKLQDHEELDDKIEAFIYKEIGIDPETNNHLEILEYNKVNLHYLGIGPNYFMLNEFGWREEVLKYKNFYEYNEGNHIYQEEAFSEDENFPDYKKQDLYNRLQEWARVEVNGEFNYLNIFSYQIWVYNALEDAEMDWIDKNLPYELVSGKNDGKRVDGGTLFDMHRDANGKEGWLDQMMDFSHIWIRDYYDSILYDNKWDCVFINDTSGKDFDGDPNKEYIFGSLDIMKNVAFTSFVEDCEKHKGDSSLVENFCDQAIKELNAALDEKFVEVQKTPKNLFKLKKKKKMNIVFADGAFDGLVDANFEDDE